MRPLLVLALWLLSAPVWAQETKPAPEPSPTPAAAPTAPQDACEGTCVPEEDMKRFVELLKERKCRDENPPTFELDPIKIVVDKEGRIFYSGAEPKPYTVKMSWCNYEIEAKGKVDVVAAMMTPPIWGFRFRPKAYIGMLPGEAFYASAENTAAALAGQPTEELGIIDVIDAGAMVDFLYYDWVNLNAAVGFRSVGLGIGADLTSNFGAYTGYALTWGDWHHNVNLGLWFSFYNPD